MVLLTGMAYTVILLFWQWLPKFPLGHLLSPLSFPEALLYSHTFKYHYWTGLLLCCIWYIGSALCQWYTWYKPAGNRNSNDLPTGI